ncbi:hypothetical protein [Risungbinella massiliensis]|uniref:hypothetical protein n=1 Tax=Risungbinella massiliensis TaxID=1329796 RepID=UPI0005CC10A6|nr:hypothetical protein [Risungbinella massiliensis]
MKITVNLSKEELDFLEEAVLQYQSSLLKSENPDQIVDNELRLCRRVVEEFGMENIEEDIEENMPMPNQYPFSR